MKRYRGARLCLNLLLAALVLVMVWAGRSFPLPVELAYRRMERAMLLEPMELIHINKEDGTVLSADHQRLALFTGEFQGFPTYRRTMYLFPLENGLGRAIRKQPFFGTDIWAYDASENAIRVEMALTLRREGAEPHTIYGEANAENGFFPIHLEAEAYHDGMTDWQETAIDAMIAAEIGSNLHFADHSNYESGYSMTLTFYDAAGNVTAVHESEGTYAY